MENRISRLRGELRRRNLPNFFVTRLPNIRYLCGYSGSAGYLLITPKKARFFSDFRYESQAREEVFDAEIIIYRDDIFRELKRRRITLRGAIGFEAEWLDVATYEQFQMLLPGASKWVPTARIAEKIAALKDPDEIDKIRRAVAITDAVFQDILPLIKPGVRELDISAEISYLNKKKGAGGDAFSPIVASGPRSALPHGLASERRIGADEPVLVDMGCVYDGYSSDLTRTVFMGNVDPKLKDIYSTVQAAQKAALDAARAGLPARDLDRIARDIIRSAGYGDYFGHGLGHGLGLDVHSEPKVFFGSDDVLQESHIFTIEPGIYLPGIGGVRIEDDVLISKDGAEILTHSTRELIEL